MTPFLPLLWINHRSVGRPEGPFENDHAHFFKLTSLQPQCSVSVLQPSRASLLSPSRATSPFPLLGFSWFLGCHPLLSVPFWWVFHSSLRPQLQGCAFGKITPKP